MSNTSATAEGPLVLVGTERGVTLIPRPTPLTRLNYFDGKFLRADDLTREQRYLRSLVELSNQAGGPGIVHGFDTTLGDGRATLELRPGLAIDPAGRVLYLPHSASIGVRELIERSRRQAASNGSRTSSSRTNGGAGFDHCEIDEASDEEPGSAFAVNLYLISIAHVEALCGEEDVYGKLCEDACVTSSDRPYRLEGVVVRASPLSLRPGTCDAPWLGARHLRSRVASAYFADERRRLGRLMSGERLRLDTWCLGAQAEPGNDVPIAVIAVDGDAVRFLDAWTARRERMESPARRYWAWQTMMRPWAVYLAQILQFQCQLRGVLAGGPQPDDPEDPCSDQNRVLRAAQHLLEAVEPSEPAPSVAERPGMAGFGIAGAGGSAFMAAFDPDFVTRAAELRREVVAALEASLVPRRSRILIDGGIVELPPAGYLPVVPGATSVETQVRRLLGDGVDLRFCVVRPDYVAHALEEAQHMERVCLLRGLEDPALREAVDVLVPDGELVPGARVGGLLFDTSLEILPSDADDSPGGPAPVPAPPATHPLRGIGRAARLPGGGGAFHFAGSTDLLGSGIANLFTRAFRLDRDEATFTRDPGETDRSSTADIRASAVMERASSLQVPLHAWASLRSDRDPFELRLGESTRLHADVVAAVVVPNASVAIDVTIDGPLVVEEPVRTVGQLRRVRGRVVRARAALTRISNGAEDENVSERFSLAAELEVRRTPDGETTVDITLRHDDGVTIRLDFSWRGAPLTVQGEASFRRIWYERQQEEAHQALQTGDTARAAEIMNRIRECVGLPPITPDQVHAELGRLEDTLRGRTPSANCQPPEEPLGRATLREDSELAGPEHPLRARASATLARIEQALAQPGFRETATQLLFPAGTAERLPTVRATRDWVLFHRRRDRRCGSVERPPPPPPAPPPQPPATVRFAAYQLHLDERFSLEEALEIIDAGAASRLPIRRLSEDPRFTGSGVSLVTDAGALRDAWSAAGPGQLLLYGTVAPAGPASDPDLPRRRLDSVLEVLESVTPRAATFTEAIRPTAPAGVPAEGAGMMLLITGLERVQVERRRLVVRQGDGQTEIPGTRLSEEAGVQVVNAESGDPVVGASVTFTFRDPSGAVTGVTTRQTNADGFASVPWTLGSEPGRYTLEASSPQTEPAQLHADALAGTPMSRVFSIDTPGRAITLCNGSPACSGPTSADVRAVVAVGAGGANPFDEVRFYRIDAGGVGHRFARQANATAQDTEGQRRWAWNANLDAGGMSAQQDVPIVAVGFGREGGHFLSSVNRNVTIVAAS